MPLALGIVNLMVFREKCLGSAPCLVQNSAAQRSAQAPGWVVEQHCSPQDPGLSRLETKPC